MRHRPLLIGLFILDVFLVVGFYSVKYYFEPKVVVVPHHNLVQNQRRLTLASVAQKRLKTKTIVIISPDHFNPNQYGSTSTVADWSTAKGVVYYDQNIGQSIQPLVQENEAAVKNDHGIYNLVSDIHTFFPKAAIVPILLGQQSKPSNLQPLNEAIQSACRSDCLLIASVDFSHYLPSALADVHDAQSFKTLMTTDLQNVMELEVDSPQSLYLALSHAQSHHLQHFNLSYHTNSGHLQGNPDVETTSHILGWFERGKPTTNKSQTFVYATNLDIGEDQVLLGKRFFYGASITNTKLASPVNPVANLTINPVSSSSSIAIEGHRLTLHLGPDLAIAGINSDFSWSLVFLPLYEVDGYHSLSRGETKQQALNQLFVNLPVPFHSDSKKGIINYN